MFGFPVWAIKPLLYLAGVAAIGLALWRLHHHIYQNGYDDATRIVEARYAERDRIATKAANDRIQELQTAARAKERESATQVAEISGKYQSEITNAQAKVGDLQRRVAAGTVRLRDNGAVCPAAGGGSGLPETRAGSGRPDGGAAGNVPDQTAGVLSIESSQFLIALAGECDGLAAQLKAAQSIIAADRK